MDIVYKARVFATAAHYAVKQVRKYTGEPYIVHPAEVVNILYKYGATDEMAAAGWLHDTVEDTGVTIDVIYYEFGQTIGEYVNWLTDQTKPEDGNRAVRKKMDADRLALAPAEVQTVKYADLISNTRSITEYDAGFAKTYLVEKAYLLSVMTKGNPHLYELAMKNIVSV
jgi:(p)ppGpp synthase/HD superfamily hydrolase